eukprot:c29027_g1_i1 orf=235-1353(-)
MTRRMMKAQTTVQDLPDQCLAYVFSLLHSKADKDAAALTCRPWRTIVADSRPTLILLPEDFLLDQWARRFPQVRHTFPSISSLIIYCNGIKLPKGFLMFLQDKGFSQLKSLCLENCPNVSIALMGPVAHGCPALTHLSVIASRITDAGFRSLAHGCTNLVFLEVSSTQITDAGIDVVLTKCPNMMEIQVKENYGSIEGWGFRNGKALQILKACGFCMTDAGFEEGLQGAKSLRHLDLRLEKPWPSLAPISECCNLLEVLCLRFCQSLDDFVIQRIAQCCKELRELNVTSCHRVTLCGWQVLAHSAIKLEDLYVNECKGFNEDSLLAIEIGCPKLSRFVISSPLISQSALERFRDSRPAVRSDFDNAWATDFL